MHKDSCRGNVLFLLLLAIVVFAALGYAVTNWSRGGGKDASADKASMTAAEQQQYASLIENTVMRLTTTGNCTNEQINYESPSGSYSNPNAPLDKHCNVFNVAGGNVPYRNLGPGANCPLTTLVVGQACMGAVYAGMVGSNRIYATTSTNAGPYTWNNGASSGYNANGATSSNNGSSNTDKIMSSGGSDGPYAAASYCRSIGPEWYLPAVNELNLIYTNKGTGSLNGGSGFHWTSTETGSSPYANTQNMSTGSQSNAYKYATMNVRCVRRD